MQAEVEFDVNESSVPNVSSEFYQMVNEFIDETEEEIRTFFDELFTYQRPAFMVEIGAPVSVLIDLELFMQKKGYFIYDEIQIVEKGDENKEYLDQELFEKYPGQQIGASTLFVTLRPEFMHLAKISETIPWGCGEHFPPVCDPRAALRGLLFGYNVKNIIGFVSRPCEERMQ